MSKDFGVAHQMAPYEAEIDMLKAKLRYARNDADRSRGLMSALGPVSDLAVRLWCGDMPDAMTLDAIDTWVDGLPEDEAAALNALLGQSFERRDLAWDSTHPVSTVIRHTDPDIPDPASFGTPS